MKTILNVMLAVTFSALTCLSPAAASPGAHGPNGEHLDTQQSTNAGGAASPKLEAKSELFELVARLDGGELSILIDRFATNEPVLNATVEVESGTTKATARFHGDLGDYAVDDAAMLKLLATPGEHALVFTVIAGNDSDLLDGILRNGTSSAGHDEAHAQGMDHHHAWGGSWVRWAAGAVIALALLLTWRSRKTRGGDALFRKLNGDKA
jgi:hypothetical protein